MQLGLEISWSRFEHVGMTAVTGRTGLQFEVMRACNLHCIDIIGIAVHVHVLEL